MSRRVPLRTKRSKTGPPLRRLQRKLWDLRADQYNLWIELRAVEHRGRLRNKRKAAFAVARQLLNEENIQQLIRAVAVLWAHDPPQYIEPSLGCASTLGTAALGSRSDGQGMLAGDGGSEWVEMVTDNSALTIRVVLDGNTEPGLHVDFARGRT